MLPVMATTNISVVAIQNGPVHAYELKPHTYHNTLLLTVKITVAFDLAEEVVLEGPYRGSHAV